MFGWNKTKKHNQYSPTNQKVQREFNFPFRNLAIKCDLFCYSGWYGAEKPSLLSRLEPTCGKAVGHGQANSWLLGRMSDSALPPPELHRTCCRQCQVNRGAESTNTENRMWRQQAARTLCFFMGYTSRAKEGKGERALLGRGAGWAPKLRWRVRLLSPHLGK